MRWQPLVRNRHTGKTFNTVVMTELENMNLSPHYGKVPKEPEANKKFREELFALGDKDADHAATIMKMCAEDICFWLNTCVKIFEPRGKDNHTIDLNTWPVQDDHILQIKKNVGVKNMCTQKSRDMAGTWDHLLVMAHEFLFHDYFTGALQSHNEKAVDEKGKLGTLMPKLDFIFENLPKWMQPKIRRKKLLIENLVNHAMITGSPTTKKADVGARYQMLFIDEVAKIAMAANIIEDTADISDSIFYCSTPHGPGSIAFFELCDNHAITQFELSWTKHPKKAWGMYQWDFKNDSLIFFDNDRNACESPQVKGDVTLPPDRKDAEDVVYKYPDEYPFVKDGIRRSPAYDYQDRRRKNRRYMAENWDMSRTASNQQFFTVDWVVLEDLTRPPILVGDFMFDPDVPTGGWFEPREDGPLTLYRNLFDGKLNVQIPIGAFDIAAGSGASNSCGSIGDGEVGERVLEYADPNITPEAYARKMVALCRWIAPDDGVYMLWDAGGVGGVAFGKEVIKLGYRNVYYKRDVTKVAPKPTDTPGYYMVGGSEGGPRAFLFSQLNDALKTGRYTERSIHCLNECKDYIYDKDLTIQHIRAVQTKDSSGAKANHGDRVVSAALMWYGMTIRGNLANAKTVEEANKKPLIIPEDCPYNRLKRFKRAGQKSDYTCFS